MANTRSKPGARQVPSQELERLRAELAESEETLRAIRSGEVDALVVSTAQGEQVYTLKGADEAYRILLEELTEGALTISADGIILYANTSFANFTRTPLEKIIGSRFEDLVQAADRDSYFSLLSHGRSARARGMIRLSAGDGSTVPALLSVSALPAESASTWCIVATDMTDQIKSQEALQKANEELELKVRQRTENLAKANEELARSNSELQSFAYVASHDLREPLRTISGFLELLQMDYGDKLDQKSKDYISRAVNASTRLHEMIDDLLSYSRLETRKRVFTRVDLNGVCQAALNDLNRAIEENGAKIEVKTLPTVMADELQIPIVFRNLIDNAIKFHDKTVPEIVISATRDESEWLISVKDNGIGIDPVNQRKIFEMFKRLHSRDEYPGSGIGLAMCKKIVERHGGRIWVKSSIGNGSIFFFTLPSNLA